MEWTEASIYTSTEGVELLCGKLLELGINGFAVEDAQDFEAFLEETTPHWDYVDDSLMALKDAETRVIVYLPKNVQGAQTLAAVSSVVRALKADDAEAVWAGWRSAAAAFLEEDWENNWKQYYKPIQVGKHLVVVPPGRSMKSRRATSSSSWIRAWLSALGPMPPPAFAWNF